MKLWHVRRINKLHTRRWFHAQLSEIYTDKEFDCKLKLLKSPEAFAAFLRQCRHENSLSRAKKLHFSILREHPDGFNTYLGNLLIEIYGKCGSLADAHEAFNRTPHKNIFTWTVLITAYAQNGHGKEAIETLWSMDLHGEKPNAVTLLGILVACSSSGDAVQGRIAHDRIVSCGFDSQINVGNALVHMYSKCGSVQEARRVFDSMRVKNIISFNTMLKAYVAAGMHLEAVQLFEEIFKEPEVAPNAVTFTTVLGACSCPEWGIAVHERVAETGLESDVGLNTALVNMYGKCGLLTRAKKVFESMEEKTVVTWTALISANAQHGHYREAVQLYRRMESEGTTPNEVTFLSVLSACSSMNRLCEGREIHTRIVSLGLKSVTLMNAVLVMYIKCRRIHEAEDLFTSMHVRDLKSWLFIISGYAQQGHPHEAIDTYKKMDMEPDETIYAHVLAACSQTKNVKDGKAVHERIVTSGLESDTIVGTALVDFYSNTEDLLTAKSVFEKISAKDAASWNAMLVACVQNKKPREAIEMFHRMNLEGSPQANNRTYIPVLEACTEDGEFATGTRVYKRVVENGYELDTVLGTGIVNMFGKCGDLRLAQDVFDRMPNKDLVSWTAMIAAYTRNGLVQEARTVYRKMMIQGFEPDEITYISILSSCAHAGLVDEGWRYLVCMSEDTGILPNEEHYLCVIDLLGRAGRLDEAQELAKGNAFGFVGWTSVLGSCRTHGDSDRAHGILKEVMKLDTQNSAPYLLLAHTYHHAA